jgi:hypothetical protein
LHVHAADTACGLNAGRRVEPVEFALHLDRKLARRRDDKAERPFRRLEALRASEQRRGYRYAERHRLAGAGLRRHQKIGLVVAAIRHLHLNRR